MIFKEKIRKKFLLLRKKKYFIINYSFFKPLLKIINSKNKKNISLYYPSNYEVDTLNLFKILGKRKDLSTSLPVLLPNGMMKFLQWKLFEPLRVNTYGFLEPLVSGKSVNPDLIIVPLLAYDKFYNRLGYGKGYYDKFFTQYLKNRKNILTIGLAFSFQKYKKIPISKFDVKLNYILTEKGIF